MIIIAKFNSVKVKTLTNYKFIILFFLRNFTFKMLRDLVWTLIIIWLIYRLVAMFKGTSQKKVAFGKDNNSYESNTSNQTHTQAHTDTDIKKAVKKSTDKEGEYVEYEEVK